MKAGIILIVFGLILAGGMAALYFYMGKQEQKPPPQEEEDPDPLDDRPQFFTCPAGMYWENGEKVWYKKTKCIIGHHTTCYRGKCLISKTR